MFRKKKYHFPLQLSSAPLSPSRQLPLLPTHLEALTSNVTAAGRRPSDVRRTPGSREKLPEEERSRRSAPLPGGPPKNDGPRIAGPLPSTAVAVKSCVMILTRESASH